LATVFPYLGAANNTINFPIQTPATMAIATGNTIPTNLGVIRVTTAAAASGLILSPGTVQGQLFMLIGESAAANTLTFAAVGTSNVGNGVTAVLTPPAAMLFVWDTGTSLWYEVF